MTRMKLLGAMTALMFGGLVGGLTGQAQAASVLVDPTDYTGFRKTAQANGIVPAGIWAVNGLQLSWNISFDNNTNLFTYVYKISDDSGSNVPIVMGGVSHFLLEVSPTFTHDNIKDGSSVVVDPTDYVSSGGTGQNPNMPAGGIHAIKFNFGGTLPTYTLVTDRAPIWGDFYTKDGTAGGMGQNTAWNSGFGSNPTDTTTDFTYWIPTPDTVSVVPVPAAAWMGLVTLGVAGLARLGRRRSEKA